MNKLWLLSLLSASLIASTSKVDCDGLMVQAYGHADKAVATEFIPEEALRFLHLVTTMVAYGCPVSQEEYELSGIFTELLKETK